MLSEKKPAWDRKSSPWCGIRPEETFIEGEKLFICARRSEKSIVHRRETAKRKGRAAEEKRKPGGQLKITSVFGNLFVTS